MQENDAEANVWFLLVGRGQPAFDGVGADKVKISTDGDVADLRKKVREENQRIIEGVAAHLKVYSTKDDITDPANALKVRALIGDGGGTEDMPLFVVVPKKTHKRSLRSIVPASVDVNKAGLTSVIPIADNVLGLAKSEFGHCKSKETWPDAATRDNFQQTLCNCHTIAIEFHNGALFEDTFDAMMIKLLCKALKDVFVIQPAILSTPPSRVSDFLDDLTEVAGPVFIVLDKIEKAFHRDINSLDDFQQREQFLFFCNGILDSWFTMKNVVFVVVGHASYLNYVGPRPWCSYKFERLNTAACLNIGVEKNQDISHYKKEIADMYKK
ncbi:hypothetical protein BJ741DRAFT_577501 [Chytriomyces cf. hyalinus JEL632]|nr:hypothetical protein BJ741DRAFT_577501 [Chytriomyces cf. hyalinus JEL632]